MIMDRPPTPLSGKPGVPRVSVGIPAYNSAATIAAALDGILNQTFRDLEVIVGDNASTDKTVAIVEAIAARDSRVRVLRQERNIGANGNYSAVAGAARGEYFKWMSSSDWCPPDFLAVCVDFLDRHPEAVVAAPSTRLYETDPSDALDYADDIEVTGADPVQRLEQLVSTLQLNNAMNGLIRQSALRQTRLIDHYPHADIVLMGHLALLGRIHLLPERLIYRRTERMSATKVDHKEAWLRHHYPRRTWRSLFPSWRMYIGWCRAVAATPLTGRQKWRAWRVVFRMFRWSREALLADLVTAARFPFPRGDRAAGHRG